MKSTVTSGRSAVPTGYRPALDGLRAVAVLAVIAYHLGSRWAKGGYLGVDLFFVLSGYLITSILVDEQSRTGQIDFLNFWAHRVRRLLPALLLCLITLAFATRLLLPETEWPLREADLFWALFYAANWHQIAAQQDYFAAFVGASSLRHLWSLAIEEQFYLLWPLVLTAFAFARIVRMRAIWAVACATVISAALMFILYATTSQSRAYYGTDSRAHELLIGALLALAQRSIPAIGTHSKGIARVGAPILVVLVLSAFVLLRDSSALYYIGGSTVFATLVAGLIWAVEFDPGGLVGRILSSAVPRWIGQISYGLYLWHWPSILLTRRLLQYVLGPYADMITGQTLNAVRVGLTFAAATFSFYVVETAIRRRNHRFLTNRRVALSLAPIAAAMSGLFLLVGQVPASDIALVQRSSECPGDNFVCVVAHPGPPNSPVVALMGDSVARSLDPAIAEVAVNRGWSYVMAARDGCSVLQRWASSDDGTATRRRGWDSCYNVLPEIYGRVLATKPQLIVATDRWLLAGALDDKGRLLQPGTEEHLIDTEGRLESWVISMTSKGSKVALIHILPVGLPVDCENTRFAQTPACLQKASDDTLTPKYNAIMDRVASRHPDVVFTVDLEDIVCPSDSCPPKIDGIWIRSDGVHFTIPGAMWLAKPLNDRLPH